MELLPQVYRILGSDSKFYIINLSGSYGVTLAVARGIRSRGGESVLLLVLTKQ